MACWIGVNREAPSGLEFNHLFLEGVQRPVIPDPGEVRGLDALLLVLEQGVQELFSGVRDQLIIQPNPRNASQFATMVDLDAVGSSMSSASSSFARVSPAAWCSVLVLIWGALGTGCDARKVGIDAIDGFLCFAARVALGFSSGFGLFFFHLCGFVSALLYAWSTFRHDLVLLDSFPRSSQATAGSWSHYFTG